MNKIGAVTDTGIRCTTLSIDAKNGEYLASLSIAYELEGTINYI